jgi:hypothetical protein
MVSGSIRCAPLISIALISIRFSGTFRAAAITRSLLAFWAVPEDDGQGVSNKHMIAVK